jgi:hypothetical protein
MSAVVVQVCISDSISDCKRNTRYGVDERAYELLIYLDHLGHAGGPNLGDLQTEPVDIT